MTSPHSNWVHSLRIKTLYHLFQLLPQQHVDMICSSKMSAKYPFCPDENKPVET